LSLVSKVESLGVAIGSGAQLRWGRKRDGFDTVDTDDHVIDGE
jgi:hypothetical protein